METAAKGQKRKMDPNCIMDSTQRTGRQLLVPVKTNKIDDWGDPDLSHLEDQT